MNSFDFKAVLLPWLQTQVKDAIEVLDFYDDSDVFGSGCDTCGYGAEVQIRTVVVYKTSTDKTYYFYHRGSFSDLIKELEKANR